MVDLRIYADDVEQSALEQIERTCKSPAFEDAQIRIMPDVHAGKGSVIGFTAHVTNGRVIPNVVGVDIGCGVHILPFGRSEIDFVKLDRFIRKKIPSGFKVYPPGNANPKLLPVFSQFRCYEHLYDIDRLARSMGTLGGNNHMCEIDQDQYGYYYLIIHSGSRNLGLQVANYYQDLAIQKTGSKSSAERQELIADLKAQGRESEIEEALQRLPRPNKADDDLAYLEGEDAQNYLHDMSLCVEFARMNRWHMGWRILEEMSRFEGPEQYLFYIGRHVIHNYIEILPNGSFMIRKGAISAKFGELVLIPLNMQSGCIVGVGKGNPEWNMSAPHGAGRRMSRTKASKTLTMDDFKSSMEGIYTTSVCSSTLDESPMAYKDPEEIMRYINETVYDVRVLKPVYNFKAHEGRKRRHTWK